MIKINIFLIIFLFLVSCESVVFTYNKKNASSPIYEKTNVSVSGKEIPSVYRYASKYIGNANENLYDLHINIQEIKTKRSVQSNQAVSKMDYELIFNYSLLSISDSCVVFETNVSSEFSYVPKSSGYNFGSDNSLEKSYELASENNVVEFINILTVENISQCK